MIRRPIRKVGEPEESQLISTVVEKRLWSTSARKPTTASKKRLKQQS